MLQIVDNGRVSGLPTFYYNNLEIIRFGAIQ